MLSSKWTAVEPFKKEKHFLVSELEFDDEGNVVHCLIEAVISNRAEKIDWKALKDSDYWLQGWQ